MLEKLSSANSTAIDCTQIKGIFIESLQNLLNEWRTTSFNVRRILGGKSGASVYLVDIKCDKHNGQAILKLSQSALTDDIKGMQIAKAHSKALAKMIPELTHSKESEEFNAILQSVAGDGFLQAAPLATTPDNILNTGFQILSELLLSEWNGKAAFSNQYYGPAEILSEILGDRVKEDGRIWDFAKNILEIDEEQSTISVNLKPYPNPLSLLNTTIPSATAQQQMLRGLSHGDFHSENVLARYSTTIQKMFVIDFDATKNDQPLLFDNAYLELSHLLKMRGDQSYDSWIDVCNQLVKIEDQKDVERDIEVNDDRGLLWTVGMLRGSIWRWQRNYHAARLDDLYKQALLARVGAGLNFAAKRSLSDDPVKSNKMKTLAFIYAASAAKGYYEFCKIPLSLNVKPIALIGSRPSPSNDSWRSVWRAADDFTASSGRYILVASEDLENLHSDNLNNLARLPWSLVIDLSKKTTDGLFYSVASTHMKLRGTFSALFPSQATAGRNDTDCCWLFAESNDDMGIADWRRAALPALRNQIRHEYQKITPLPLYLIVLGKRATPAKLRAIVSAAEEEVGSLLKTIVVVSDEDDTTNDSLRDEAGSFQAIKCSWTDFALGVLRMLGESHLETSPTTVPAYSAEQNAVRPLTLDREVASRYLTSLRLVGSRGLDAGQWTDEGIGRFYQGNLITWEELNLRHDIVREGYEGDKGWLNTIRSILKSNPSRSIKLLHSVGAGGTTVARRIAWDLRREFPAVMLNSFNDHSIDDIEYLFHLTRLPVFVVIEASRVSPSNRDRVFEGLKSRSVRFLILDVCRDHAPQDSDHAIAVPDPMTVNESLIFENLFSKLTVDGRLPELMRLKNPSHIKYRIPFFYGLVAFEKDFAKIEDFIEGAYEETPANSRRWLALLSLVSRFSQLMLPYSVFQNLVGLVGHTEVGSPTGILGLGSKRAIMFDGRGIGIMHPVLAEELLGKYLRASGADARDNLMTGLADFCIWVIEELSGEHVRDNAVVQEILIDLFVDRGFWPDSVKTMPFSPLISRIPSKEGQKRVLQFLAETFPENAHFSNHLGRHINLTESGTFDEAETAIKLAIHLDPFNSIHRHALGMVYRFEAKRVLQEKLSAEETVLDRLVEVQPLISSALESFNEAVELSDSSNYPLVTPMQLVFNSLDRVLFLTRKANFGELLSDDTGVGEWCRNLLDEATVLLEKLHKLEAGSPKSEHRQRLDAEYQKVLGNYGEMISGLQQLLLKPGVNKGAIRRLLVQGYLGRTEHRSIASQRAVCSLMLQNLREGPINEFDIRTWFRAYRETPDFTISESIEKFTEWSLIADVADTHYYLHILHFLQSKLGIRASQRESLEQLTLMRQNLSGLVSKRSFEWLGSSKESGHLTIVSHALLGDWDGTSGFFKNADLLARVPATVSKISSPQAGKVDIGGIEAFFVPRSDFISPHDLNAKVECYVGFSYEGPRAWEVRRRGRH